MASYRRYALRANRTEATALLLRIQVAQEKFFLQNNSSFATTMTQVKASPSASPPGLGITLQTGDKTQSGFYTISFDSATATTYKMKAAATEAAQDAAACLNLYIDQTGAKDPRSLPVAGAERPARAGDAWRAMACVLCAEALGVALQRTTDGLSLGRSAPSPDRPCPD
ncbi:MAG: type IV pilin protein, partial [Vicinamibacterales bacterium]